MNWWMFFVNARWKFMELIKKIKVEVAYADTKQQRILSVLVDEGSTIEKVIDCSGILEIFTDIDLSKQKVGIFSQQKKLDDRVQEGDRVEIYRPLTLDPKEARKRRAKK
jgi:putative ubiquitin-RnfH superfamily antitoxin RatB of RatAB toxin-antitoxin module